MADEKNLLVGILMATIILFAVIFYVAKNYVSPAFTLLGTFSPTREMVAVLASAQKIYEVGGIGVSSDIYAAVDSFMSAYEKCREGPVRCAQVHAELFSPEILERIKKHKLSRRDTLFLQSLKSKQEMWKSYVGESNFETCGADCARAFYMPIEEKNVPVSMSPMGIAKTLYSSKDEALKLFCNYNWDNCPDVKTCIDCYQLFLEKGDAALREMLDMGCHQACFLAAKRVEKVKLPGSELREPY